MPAVEQAATAWPLPAGYWPWLGLGLGLVWLLTLLLWWRERRRLPRLQPCPGAGGGSGQAPISPLPWSRSARPATRAIPGPPVRPCWPGARPAGPMTPRSGSRPSPIGWRLARGWRWRGRQQSPAAGPKSLCPRGHELGWPHRLALSPASPGRGGEGGAVGKGGGGPLARPLSQEAAERWIRSNRISPGSRRAARARLGGHP